ncbi:MAG: hypothetical protein RL637_326 [Pseudomonadota bacterium]|jgi:lysyl-tRNA synthetase class 2
MIAWQPTASLAQLRLRAQMLATIRQFFAARGVLEVETPLLAHTTTTEPGLTFFATEFIFSHQPESLFLQTSPEFAMKRLLAAGSGSIYQICKAFRNSESGRFHNPEFTMLEWYRIGFDLTKLIEEVCELLQLLLATTDYVKTIEMVDYVSLFQQITALDPLNFCLTEYRKYARDHDLSEAIELCEEDQLQWLDFIFSHQIQPHLGQQHICIVRDYPAIFPSLARLKPTNPLLTERFEIFIQGLELGNGFFELTDAKQQRRRFEQDLQQRQQKQLPTVKIDEYLLAALTVGLPECSGIAIGLDRLLMVLSNCSHIDEILSFPLQRA